MNSIYVIHTPYHLLITCGLAISYDCSNEKYLVIVPDFKDATVFYQSIIGWKDNPFTEVILLSGVYNVKFGNTIKTMKSNLKTINQLFRTKIKDYGSSYIFNDGRVEGQLIAYLNYTKNGSNFYVEDGSAAYNCYVQPDINFYLKIIYKLIYGSWYEHVRILGMYKYIDRIMVFRPDLIRKELQN